MEKNQAISEKNFQQPCENDHLNIKILKIYSLDQVLSNILELNGFNLIS